MQTVLYENHIALGAKIIEFAGWQMPLQYKGILHEHKIVRSKAGVFDVSHMGKINVEGDDAENLLDYLSTNSIKGRPDLSATYTVLPNPSGGSVDDVIIYKINDKSFFIIVNAGNRQKDLAHLVANASGKSVEIKEKYLEEGILAIQGPQAINMCTSLFPQLSALKPMRFIPTTYKNTSIILSGTGYTGSGGFEIYASNEIIPELWELLLHTGIEPIGLGARDTLRLEKGYALYGHELTDAICANESVSAWTVHWNKENFLGRQAMEIIEKDKSKRMAYGVKLREKKIPREGYKIYKNGNLIGRVTSGTFSPSLNEAIALILVDTELHEGSEIDIEIRNSLVPSVVIKLPFI